MSTTLSMYFWEVSITQLGLVHINILFNSSSCNNVLSVILCIFHTRASFFLFDATVWVKQGLSSSLLDKSWVVDLPLSSQFYPAWTLPLEASQATSLDAGRKSRRRCFCVSGWQGEHNQCWLSDELCMRRRPHNVNVQLSYEESMYCT